MQLDPINQPADPKELLGPRQTDGASGYAGNRKVGTGDKPFDWPRDDTKNSTAPLIDTNPGYEWGREAPALARRVSWPSYATDPGRPGPLDTTDTNPKRPDFGAPSNDAYDISGKGEGEVVIGGEEGKYPDPNKKQNWA
ncbi:MAG: hypothetical protein DMG55_08230 [Acidobacteria bacterium]|nr:MAG: hypothetical protein DMG55_08230 [Acidobacteriota bacterium]